MVQRDIIENGSVHLHADGCTFLYRRLRPGALHITIEGNDNGQFGSATVDEIAQEHARVGTPVRLYIDARCATGPSTIVMETWTAWLAANRDKLHTLVILIPESSKLLHLTVSIAQHLSRTGNLIRICSDEQEFTAAIENDLPTR